MSLKRSLITLYDEKNCKMKLHHFFSSDLYFWSHLEDF